ncbi:MAG: DUF1345 domain-containing protein [Chthoniobacteraceae bacterium]|nr:DUF1345 domain-containing protein [Chthoniobacteraceae bacterium]
MKSPLRRIETWDSHHRLFAATGAAFLAAFLAQGRLPVPLQIVLTWNTFAAAVLLLAWARILTGKASESHKTARLQDTSRVTILLFVLATACASLLAVGYFLASTRQISGEQLLGRVLLGLCTVIGSWLLIHTLFALHYAHLYYRAVDAHPGSPNRGGLLFPHEPMPDYLDFAYFSFVVGMTCQVSDVQISGRGLRALALLHGLLSFAFNTAILALCINVLSGLLAR